LNDGSVPSLPSAGATRRKKALARQHGRGQPRKKKTAIAKSEEPKAEFDARTVARNLITDPEYQKKLRARLLEGSLGNLEIWLWRYAGGDPKPDDAEMEAQKLRFTELRERLQILMRESPQKAAAMEAGVLGRKRLPMPRQLEVTVLNPDGTESSRS